jgi:hypothetical protein
MSKESRQRFQQTIWGTFESMNGDETVEQLIDKAIPDVPPDSQSMEYVWAAYLKSQHTRAFIESIPNIDNRALALEEYCNHLFLNKAFESFARSARPSMRNGNGTKSTPAWYEEYLLSEHWLRTKALANAIFVSCVACNRTTDLHVHHRHYESLGFEDINTDLTLLCGSCHISVHRANPNVHAPACQPEGVL